MEVAFTTTAEDVVAFLRCYLYSPQGKKLVAKRRFLYAILFFSLGVTTMSPSLKAIPNESAGLLSFVIYIGFIVVPFLLYWAAGVSLVVFYPNYLLFRAKRRLVKTGVMGIIYTTGPLRIAISPEKIEYTDSTGTHSLPWSNISQIVETDKHAFFFYAPERGLILPRSIGAEQFENFLRMAKEYKAQSSFVQTA